MGGYGWRCAAFSALATGLALSGCRTPRTDAPPTVGSTTAAPPASYEVHEWGLLRGGYGDVLEAGAVAPRFVEEPLAVDKPVLYVHTDAAFTLRRAHVDAHDGTVVESWPHSPRTSVAAHVGWYDVSVRPGAPCETTALPTRTDTACTALPAGDPCEVASLAQVRTRSAACLRMAGGTDSLLFYRARTRSFTPPLRFERVPGAAPRVRVRHVGSAPIPGRLVRLYSGPFGVGATVVDPPAPGRELLLEAGVVVDVDVTPRAEDMPAAVDARGRPLDATPGRDSLSATMVALGLDDEEVRAFLRAWDSALFGRSPEADVERSSDESVADGVDRQSRLRPSESFVYFLPAADCERVAALDFEPAPRAVKRALAVWATALPAR